MPPHKYRILLVDDYVPVRITLRSMLTGYPDLHIVGEACDGKQAIEQVAACQPDIILMDYNMPVMNGIEAARLIKKSWEATVIIGLCTVGYLHHGWISECRRPSRGTQRTDRAPSFYDSRSFSQKSVIGSRRTTMNSL